MTNPMHFQVYRVSEIAEAVGTDKSAEKWYPEKFYDARAVDEVMAMALKESRLLAQVRKVLKSLTDESLALARLDGLIRAKLDSALAFVAETEK